jgi:hypothetical protein
VEGGGWRGERFAIIAIDESGGKQTSEEVVSGFLG